MDVILALFPQGYTHRAYADIAVRKMGFVLRRVPASHMVEDGEHHGGGQPGTGALIPDSVLKNISVVLDC